jgi:hypothetical protein
MQYSFAGIWNKSLQLAPERPLEKRDYIYASELGGAFVDRWLRMRATPYSTPPNARSKRKFEAGNTTEWLIGLVIKRAGLFVSKQDRLTFQYPGLLMVSGRQDFIIGGKPDLQKAKDAIEGLELPEMMNRASLAIIEGLKELYGDVELPLKILEVKSCSDMMFNKYERDNKPNQNHEKQLWHYIKVLGYPGDIVYVNKDNLLLKEFTVTDAEATYKADIEQMTAYYHSEERPPLEQEIQFDNGWFAKNWKVEYSSYLEMLYGYKTPEAYRERWDKIAASMNRTFKRCVNGDKMTPLNLETIKEATKLFPDWDKYVVETRAKGIELMEEENA